MILDPVVPERVCIEGKGVNVPLWNLFTPLLPSRSSVEVQQTCDKLGKMASLHSGHATYPDTDRVRIQTVYY
jgi:hypothetical protein